MKLKYTFEKVELDGEIMAVPVGENAADLHSMLRLNDTASFILDCLTEEISEDDLIEKVTAEYEGDRNTIAEYVREYVGQLRENGIVE